MPTFEIQYTSGQDIITPGRTGAEGTDGPPGKNSRCHWSSGSSPAANGEPGGEGGTGGEALKGGNDAPHASDQYFRFEKITGRVTFQRLGGRGGRGGDGGSGGVGGKGGAGGSGCSDGPAVSQPPGTGGAGGKGGDAGNGSDGGRGAFGGDVYFSYVQWLPVEGNWADLTPMGELVLGVGGPGGNIGAVGKGGAGGLNGDGTGPASEGSFGKLDTAKVGHGGESAPRVALIYVTKV